MLPTCIYWSSENKNKLLYENKWQLFFASVLFIQEAHAMQEKVSAQYVNEIEMAKAQRDYELKKAAYDVEVNTKKAESEMAYQLQVQSLALDLFLKLCVSSVLFFETLGWLVYVEKMFTF